MRNFPRRFYPSLLLFFLLSGCATSEVRPVQASSTPEAGVRTGATGSCGKTYECLKVLAEVLTQVQKHYVEDVDIQALVYAAIKGMLKPLGAQNSFMEPEIYNEIKVGTKGQFGGPGLQIGTKDGRFVVISPIDDSPAAKAGIQPGDYLTKIDEEPTADLTLLEVVNKLRGPQGSKLTLTMERKNAPAPLVFSLTREIISTKSIASRLIRTQIGYVRIPQFQEATPKDLKQVLQTFQEQNIRGLILDLRNNPGGLLTATIEVAEQFLEPNKLIVVLKGRDRNRTDEYVSRHESPLDKIPMVVLVNQGTASGSEIVAGALQDHGRAVIIGTPTFGRSTIQTILPLSDGSGLRLTTALYYRPKGQPINQSKIQPDSIVEEKGGEDAPLSFAIEQLIGKMGV